MNKALAAFLLFAAALFAAAAEKEFAADSAVIANPGQGWMAWGAGSLGKYHLPYGAIYARLEWRELEPEEGKFDWRKLDELLASGRRAGLPVLFRIMCASSHSRTPSCVPDWVFRNGAKFTEYEVSSDDPSAGRKGLRRIAPDFADPIFLAAHRRFIAALAARCDGDDMIGALDIGSYGNWGEWHTYGLHTPAAPPEVRRQYAEMYLANFKKTPLLFMTDDAETLDYALNYADPAGVGLRRDGVGSPNHAKHWAGTGKYVKVKRMGEAWQSKPVVFEWYCNLAEMRRKNWSLTDAVDWMLARHPTLVYQNLQPDGPLSELEQAKLDELSRRLGARLRPARVVYPDAVNAGGELPLAIDWVNDGVARMLLDYKIEWTLTDASGKTGARGFFAADPRTIPPGETAWREVFTLPAGLAAGVYTLRLAAVDPRGRYRDFRFAIADPTCEVGKITVK